MSAKGREPVKHSAANPAAKSTHKRATAKPSVSKPNNLKTDVHGREPARQSPRHPNAN